MIDISKNPFAVHSPDAIKDLPAEQFVQIFVEDNTRVSAIQKRKHTFIWGSRGSGKSFMLRYLEPQCQFIKHGSAKEFLNSDQPFIGVYTPCKKGEIDKSELELLNDAAALTITEHLLNLTITEETISTLSEQFPEGFLDQSEAKEFAQRVVSLFDRGAIASSKEHADDQYDWDENPFVWLIEVIQEEKRRVTRFLKKVPFEDDVKYTGATSGYHDFLLPMMKEVQNLFDQDNIPIYIFLDDAFHLTENQQKVVNTWVANRDQGSVCIKISSDKERYETFQTIRGGRIEKTHDFTEVDIEEIYTRETSQYAKKVKKIMNKRLKMADIGTDSIKELLPKNDHQVEMLENIKEGMKEEWEKYDENEKPGRKSDFVSRYAKARLFQRLADGKNKRSYAGFENIVHISSGRVRDFLEPCYLMFEELVRDGEDPSEIEKIPPSRQNKVLREHSRQFLMDEMEKVKKDLSPNEMTHLDKLTTLISSLGELFYERLHDPNSREPRIFSFTIKGELSESDEISEVLNLGRRMGFFQKSTYSSKEGGGREDWYILNRRLAPEFKLDPTGFQGRMRLTPSLLRIGCQNPKEFVRKTVGYDEDQEPLTRYSE